MSVRDPFGLVSVGCDHGTQSRDHLVSESLALSVAVPGRPQVQEREAAADERGQLAGQLAGHLLAATRDLALGAAPSWTITAML